MKRFLRCVSMILLAVMVLHTSAAAAMPDFGADAEPMASTNIQNYYGFVEVTSGRFITVHFTINATGVMDELGAHMIRVQRSVDGVNWEICETYYEWDYPHIMGGGVSSYSSNITYLGEAGYQYRAFISYRAKNSTDTSTAMAYAY